ncbi:MAG: hypothetical protein NDF55_10925 [archaeon GB-1867-005]|nr:hypothetical protein [Candidatus Culexmicrobium cathedralense]
MKSIKITPDGAICEECGFATTKLYYYDGKFLCSACYHRKVGGLGVMVESKLPPKGMICIEQFTESLYMITVRREDGKELSMRITREELRNLAEYIDYILHLPANAEGSRSG